MIPLDSDFKHAFDALRKEIASGSFVFPIHFALVAVNGALIYGRCDPEVATTDEPFEVLARHITPDGLFKPPLNVMFVDAKGDAVRLVNKASGGYQVVH